MKIISRSEAIKTGEKFYYTGKVCKYGHKSKYLTSSHSCYECMKAYYKKNRESFIKKSKLWGIKNRERSNKLKLLSYHRNKKLQFIPKLIPGKTKFITRKEALAKGLKTYFNGRPCAKGHITDRNVKDKQCPICQKQRSSDWRSKNIPRIKELRKLWRQKNPN